MCALLSSFKRLAFKVSLTVSALSLSPIAGVQIQAGNHHLIHQFLSATTNLRSDSYGGSLPNRLRLLLEIVQSIREQCGQTFLLSVSFSSHHPSVDYTPVSQQDSLEMITALLQSSDHHIDLIEINFKQNPFYLTSEQLTSAFAPMRQLTSPHRHDQRALSLSSDHHLKAIYSLCQGSSCRLMLSGRDGDSGTPELYHSFFHKYCDLLGLSDIFLSPQWIHKNTSVSTSTSASPKQRSSPVMSGSYSRWYTAYLLGGRLAPKDSDELSLLLSSVVLFLFQNQFVGSLFQTVYCHLLIEQLLPLSHGTASGHQKKETETVYDSPLSLQTLFSLIVAVIRNYYWSPRQEQRSRTVLFLFQLSCCLSSFISLLFVWWVLVEVSS
jgi:hypothetical protein